MQLKTKLSLIASTLICASPLMGEDYVSIQYVYYEEGFDRASISSPSIELSKDFGVDYNLKVGLTYDNVSGASPTWFDTTSGPSAYSRDKDIHVDDIRYGYVNYEDDRTAGNALLTTRFASRDELSIGINYSDENDYIAREASIGYLHYLDASKNQSLSFGISYQSNKIDVICVKNSECDGRSGVSEITKDLYVVSGELGFTQILNERSLAKISLFYTNEDGYLSNPYMNIVRRYNPNSSIVDVVAENKPDKRISYGTTLQYIVALNDAVSSNTTYRFYNDDWDISSHTISSELYYQFNSSWLFGAGLRYYTQSESDFYNKGYSGIEEHASSDERMRDFDAIGYKGSVDYRISEALSVNVGVNLYDQKDSFNATYYNIELKYRF